MTQKITARFIIQIAGRPVETVEKALETIVNKIKEDKKLKVLEEEIIPAELDEESKLYSGIIELTIKFEDARQLLGFIADFTPNSVEIEEPQSLKFESFDFTEILNDMSTHLLKTNIQLRQAQSHIFSLNKKVKELEGSK